MPISPTTIPTYSGTHGRWHRNDRPRNEPRAPRIPPSSKTREALIQNSSSIDFFPAIDHGMSTFRHYRHIQESVFSPLVMLVAVVS
jgi:hypothetical protein